MTEFHYGKVCKRHPELGGKRYKASYACVQCNKEYASGVRRKKKVQIYKDNKELRAKLAKAEAILKEIKKKSPAYAEAIDAFLKA